MFDPQLLKSFVAVAESGGFTRAAAGLRVLGKEDKVPPLPEVDYVMETCRDDTRQVVKAFADCCQQSVSNEGTSYKTSRGLRTSKSRRRN